MIDQPRDIYRFAKNSRGELRATLTEYGGHLVVDVRVWVEEPTMNLALRRKV